MLLLIFVFFHVMLCEFHVTISKDGVNVQGNAIAQLNSGKSVVCGVTESGEFFYAIFNGYAEQYRNVLNFPGFSFISCESITGTSDGGFIVSGFANQVGWIGKFFENGTNEYVKYPGTINNAVFNDIIETSNGNYVAAGSRDSEDKCIIASFSNNGSLLWSKYLVSGADGVTSCYAVVETFSDQHIIVGGNSEGGAYCSDFGGCLVPFLAKLNSETGELIWERKITGSKYTFYEVPGDPESPLIERPLSFEAGQIVVLENNSSGSGFIAGLQTLKQNELQDPAFYGIGEVMIIFFTDDGEVCGGGVNFGSGSDDVPTEVNSVVVVDDGYIVAAGLGIMKFGMRNIEGVPQKIWGLENFPPRDITIDKNGELLGTGTGSTETELLFTKFQSNGDTCGTTSEETTYLFTISDGLQDYDDYNVITAEDLSISMILVETTDSDNILNDAVVVCKDEGCPVPYYGENCDVFECAGYWSNDSSIDVCNDLGTCSTPGGSTCDCFEDFYSGDQCQFYECAGFWSNEGSICNDGGTCNTPGGEKCACYDYYFGQKCEVYECAGFLSNETNICNEAGTCTTPGGNSCSCNDFYFGQKCDVFECAGYLSNLTESEICNGRGYCDVPGGSDCTCTETFGDDDAKTYQGSDCTLYDCLGDPGVFGDENSLCGGNGNCPPGGICECLEGYIGDNCETVDDEDDVDSSFLLFVSYYLAFCLVLV